MATEKPSPVGMLPNPFGKYKVERELGRGGMGCVYEAIDTQLGRRVALKVPHAHLMHGEALVRFQREARLLAQMDHANICTLYECSEIDGIHYLAMAFLLGRSFVKLARAGIGPREVAVLVRKCALALAAAHRAGVIHRDLKPANVMLNQHNEPIIMDFGLARADHESTMTQSGAILGTPVYMPIEQMERGHGEVGPQSDIYSLGAVLYELLCGQPPIENGPVMQVMAHRMYKEIPKPSDRRPGVDANLEVICLRAMAKEPQDRYPTMEAFAAALSAWLRPGPIPKAAAPEAPATTMVLPPSPQEESPKPQPPAAPAAREAREGGARPIPSTQASPTEDDLSPAKRAAKNRASPERVAIGIIAVGLLLDFGLVWSLGPNNGRGKDNMSGTRAGEERTFSGIKFCWIPAGTFIMGSPISEENRSIDENQVQVRLTRGFWMAKYETTQEEYERVMGKHPSYFKESGRFPVENVSWNDAMEYCEKLNSQAHSRGELPRDWKYTLPTEAQWEYACRAGTDTPFHFGAVLNGNQANMDGNYPYGTAEKGPYLQRTARVGSYPANAWGLHDMHGNVWEWCMDSYKDKLAGGVDPVATEGAALRVHRGGSWDGRGDCGSAFRGRGAAAYRNYDGSGFRAVAVPAQ